MSTTMKLHILGKIVRAYLNDGCTQLKTDYLRLFCSFLLLLWSTNIDIVSVPEIRHFFATV